MERFKLLSEEARQGVHFKEEILSIEKKTHWMKEQFTVGNRKKDLLKLMDAILMAKQMADIDKLEVVKLINDLGIEKLT